MITIPTEDISILMENIDLNEISEPEVDYKSDIILTIPCQRQIVLILFILGFICPLFFIFNRILFHRTNNIFVYNLSRTSCSLCAVISLFLFVGFIIRLSR